MDPTMVTPPPERVLVKEVNWLGDLVMSLPALRAVRRAFPHARLAVLVRQELAPFFAGAIWIDDVMAYTLSRGARGVVERIRIIAALRTWRFDLAILFPKSFDAALWPALARVPQRVGFASDARGWLLTRSTVPTQQSLESHQVHSYLQMLRDTLGIDGDPSDCAPDVDELARGRMRAWLATHRRHPGGRLIALAPAAAFGPAKEWPQRHYAALIDLLAERHEVECVLIGSGGERDRCLAVAAASRHGALIAAGEADVGDSVALLSLCAGFAGNDSGAMHVAGALGIPTVGLYGSTEPRHTGPLGPRTAVIYHPLDCSPCLQRTCRFGHYNCLTQIAADEVATALYDLGGLG
jgi:heptosyltransferase-2